MSMDRTERINSKLLEVKKFLEEQGYSVAYVCVYGSQNYGLDLYTREYESDLDFKAVIIPTLDNLVYNCKPVSKSIEFETGQIDIKDIRAWTETVVKANPAYIETLYSRYKLVDDKYKYQMNSIFRMKHALLWCLRGQFARAVYGMAKEKEAAFEHPYPSCIEDIERYGFSRKQLHHIVRLYYLLKNYYDKQILVLEPEFDVKSFLIDIKLGKYTYDNACAIRDEYMEKLKELKDNLLDSLDENKIDYSIKNDVINLSREIIKECIVNEVKGSD